MVRMRLSLSRPEEVEEARRSGLPVYLLREEILEDLGCPARFPPHLLVPRSWLGCVDSPFPKIGLLRGEQLVSPTLELLVVALLPIDPLLARKLVVRNARYLDPKRLAKLVIVEDREQEATKVRLQMFAPSLPQVGASLSLESLRRQDRDGSVQGVGA